MFNKQSVGKRVVSKKYGTGTIVSFVQGNYFPVEVNWDNPPVRVNPVNDCHFTARGWWQIGTIDTNVDITLLYNRKGTPEARRIVAMLAREYRSELRNLGNDDDSGYRGGRVSAFQDAYDMAKQLLGESK